MTTPSTTRGITEIDVWQAADALLLEGARPTIERVRNKIGRGSPNTVSPHLETWFRSLGARIADPTAFSAPPALPDPISQAATHFWEAALAAARAEVASLSISQREELAAAREDLDVERRRVQAEANVQTALSQAKEETLTMLSTRATELQNLVDAMTLKIAESDAITCELRADVSRLHEGRKHLRRQLADDRAAFDTARKELEIRTAASENRWAQEIDRARMAAKELQGKVARLDKEYAERVKRLTHDVNNSAEQRQNALSARIATLQSPVYCTHL